ncbi:MAG: hypothetical protein IJS84_00315 [Spirochaetales bacterium]|nr:hypothetical protein [Spirochaetales bacterium]
MTKLIVLDQMINSMTDFKQIIGRGTRIREKEGKTYFTVMDFRGVSRLFADPDWDGPIEQDENYDPNYVPEGTIPRPEYPPIVDPSKTEPKPYVDVNGCEVRIINKTVSVYDSNGKLLRQENIIDYTKTNILGEYSSLDRFIAYWNAIQKKEAISSLLRERGIDLQALKEEQSMADVDDYDFIQHRDSFSESRAGEDRRAGKRSR